MMDRILSREELAQIISRERGEGWPSAYEGHWRVLITSHEALRTERDALKSSAADWKAACEESDRKQDEAEAERDALVKVLREFVYKAEDLAAENGEAWQIGAGTKFMNALLFAKGTLPRYHEEAK